MLVSIRKFLFRTVFFCALLSLFSFAHVRADVGDIVRSEQAKTESISANQSDLPVQPEDLHPMISEGDSTGTLLSFRVRTDQIVNRSGTHTLRVQLEFPEVQKFTMGDNLKNKLHQALQNKTETQPAILAICGLSYWQWKSLKRQLEQDGMKFDQVHYDPLRYEKTIDTHSDFIATYQGFLGLVGWSHAAHVIAFWRGAAFVLYQYGTAKVITKYYPELLERLRGESPRLSNGYSSVRRISLELSKWFGINFATNWMARAITGPVGEAASIETLRGNIQIVMIALLSVINGSVLSVRENRILERELTNERIQQNYAKILKSYANVTRFVLFSWAFLSLQIGVQGPTIFEILGPDGIPIFQFSRIHEIIGVGSGAMLLASFAAPHRYFSAIQYVAEGSRSANKTIRRGLQACGLRLAQLVVARRK
jgi:hypothetical protein